MSLNKVLLLIAVILFVLAGLGVSLGFNLVDWGLAFGFGSMLV